MKNRFLPISVLATGIITAICSVQASATTFDDDLRAQYQGKQVMLRNFYCGKDLGFDPQGKLVSGGPSGPWTLCRDIRIEDVQTEEGELKISGHRVYLFYDPEQKQFRDVTEVARKNTLNYQKLVEDQKVSIHVQLPPDSNNSDIQAAVEMIFYPLEADFLSDAPDIWRTFLQAGSMPASKFASVSDSSGALHSQDSPQPPPAASSSPTGDDMAEPAHIGSGVSAPIPIYTPDPDYTDEARQSYFKGTLMLRVIIGSDGTVKRAFVSRPLGMGLDENSIAKVLTWKFKPSTRDGQPVVVEVGVEVQFNLYS